MGKTPFTIKQKINLQDDDFKNAYVGGQLVIDCVEIKFTQNVSENPRIYVAKGCIYASPERGVEARLICSRDPDDEYHPLNWLRKNPKPTPGTLIPERNYFRLMAQDIAGNVWTHPSVLLKIEVKPECLVLSFSIRSIQAEFDSVNKKVYTYLVFLDDLAFPVNSRTETEVKSDGIVEKRSIVLDKSKGIVCGMKVSYDNRHNILGGKYSEFIAVAGEGVAVVKEFQNRLLESLRFCTATMASPVMSETVFNGKRVIELAKSIPLNNHAIVDTPISTSAHAAQDFYRLFECYYLYACKSANGADFAPISNKIGGLFNLKGVWIIAVALMLSVAVEGILKEERFKDIVKNDASLNNAIHNIVQKIQLADDVTADFKNRAISAISGFSSARPLDKLKVLSKVGALEEEDWKKWQKIRNKSAHGSFDIDDKDHQSMLDDVYRLTTLLYKLVFLLIDYSGQYSDRADRTDRASLRWPTKQFEASIYWQALDTPSIDNQNTEGAEPS